MSIRYTRDFLTVEESIKLFDHLISGSWQQEEIVVFKRRVKQPRLTRWYGRSMTAESRYRQAGVAEEWSAELQALKDRIESFTGAPFNALLVNYYRNGQDSVDWHSDDEACLGKDPTIASLSLGAARRFYLRQRSNHEEQIKMLLEDGSLLIMDEDCQEKFQHKVPKMLRVIEPRMNLTFRKLLDSEQHNIIE